jgi:hypothetical protein
MINHADIAIWAQRVLLQQRSWYPSGEVVIVVAARVVVQDSTIQTQKQGGSRCAIGWTSRLDSGSLPLRPFFVGNNHARLECRPSSLVGCLLARRARNKKIRVLGPLHAGCIT